MKKSGKRAESEVIRGELRSAADAAKAAVLKSFFKTGPGEYGENDRFHGVPVPGVRKVVQAHLDIPLSEVRKLLCSPYHEERLAALLILVDQYRRGDRSRRKRIFDFYLSNTARINNWDLVDLSAPHIVGGHLFGRKTSILTRLARSDNLWERRIAILATHYFIRQGDGRETLRLAGLLLGDPHDLIHKAAGWMLREAGKRCSMEDVCGFLDANAAVMPRTMLRYALERFPRDLRFRYMQMGKNKDRR